MNHAGELAALATALCWTVTSLSFQAAGRRVGSVPVNVIRLVIAIVLLGVWGALTRGEVFPIGESTHAYVWLGVSGLVGFTLGDLFLFRAFVLIGARLSMLIMSLVPLMTALTGWLLLDETLSRRDWMGMALTLGGVAIVAGERQRNGGESEEERGRLSGVGFALAGAAGQAVGLVLSKVGMGDGNAFAATQIRAAAGVAGFVVVVSALRGWKPVGAALRNRAAMSRISLGAFFGPFLGVSLSLIAIQRTATGVAATIMSIVPVLIIPPAVVIFRERVTIRAVIGAVVAVGGIALLFL